MADDIFSKVNQINADSRKDFLESEKLDIIEGLKNIENDLDKSYDLILAEVLNIKGDEISDENYVGDKFEYIKYLSEDETISKKLNAATEQFAKAKDTVTNSAIKLIKFKANLFEQNQQILNELEEEIILSTKEKTKLNLAIIEDESEIKSNENYIQNLTHQLDTLNGLEDYIKSQKIELIKKYAALGIVGDSPSEEELSKMSPSDREDLEKIAENIRNTSEAFEKLLDGKSLDTIQKEIDDSTSKIEALNTNINNNNIKLTELDIEGKKKLLEEATISNLELFDSIEIDIAQYKEIGIELTPEQLEVAKSIQKDEKPIDNETASTKQQPKQQQEKQQPIQQVASTNPQNDIAPNATGFNNQPIPLSDRQIASNLKSSLLGSSNKDVNNMFKNGKMDDLIFSIPLLNRTEKKVLSTRLSNLNEKLNEKEITKLKNIILALDKSDICDKIDIDKFIYDGKFKELNSIAPEDIEQLNAYIQTLDKNKNVIDDEQFDFIQNTFIRNLRSQVLVDAIKPKSLKEFIKKGLTSRRSNQYKGSKNINLMNSISTISKHSTRKVQNIDDFHKSLFGKTITPDNIEYPPPSENTKEAPTI